MNQDLSFLDKPLCNKTYKNFYVEIHLDVVLFQITFKSVSMKESMLSCVI